MTQKYDKIDTPEIVGSLFNVLSEPMCDCPEYGEDIECVMDDKVVLGCRFFSAGENAPTLLYFHDSTESINKYNVIAQKYTKYDINFLLATYRGLGKNSEKPGIASMFEDAQCVLQETVRLIQNKQLEGPLFVMGRSLGCACVIDIAYNCADSIKGIIIESGFCDTVPFLRGLDFDITKMGLIEADGFNNREKIEKIKLPTLILHGSRDSLVPPAQAETLQATSGAKNKQFHVIPGADRGTMIETGGELYFQTIKNFVDTVSGINTWRQRRRKYQ
jgi:alpha-beta hydrolase superfamily lysophospholipase